ncbi:hypothetical protein HO133_006165 [Letharia lupina]|uniref:Aminoglycoside phosphotransferase domain-containing protein n=1 Tax=Letharia lupina TaxID=560253 RepID=A0A8H6C7D0_9LECA|nr:uncharacterized protein HO133_006165 [Letharia lupina]KAF6218204.1 hypothetical protein HO133_006165 [Letharia lupina]
MESTTTPAADSKQSPGNGALIRPPNDSENVFQPANESFPPANTGIMDTSGEEATTEPQRDTQEKLQLANESSPVSSSISIGSRTSTLEYSQEPFDQYQVHVKELCHVLWPAESRVATPESRVGGVAKTLFFEAVRLKKLRRFLSPSPETDKEYIIERLAGGTYNRIVGITVKDTGTVEPKNLVLRVPRPQMAEFGYIEREVAILRYVRQNTTLPVADVISFDATANNPLESGYVVQSRLPGVSLHAIWDELTHEQRCTVAQEVGKIILALQDVDNSTPGVVEASPADDGAQNFSVRPFDIKSPYDVDWKTKIPDHIPDEETEPATQTPLNWFGTQFGRWLAHELLDNPAQILYWDYQYQFVQVTKQMDSIGILGDGQNCLCHFDLAARNVMVQVLPNGALTVSGMVDWDSAAFAPKFVSCAPPSWLWTDQKYYDAEESETSSTPSTPEQQELKEVFDDVVGFDWTWLAYRPEYRLARELFHFAQHGLPDSEAAKKAKRFLKEWAALYESMMNPKKDDASSKASSRTNEIQKDETADGVGQDGAFE